ncbi:MAG: NADH-quinone oxidoreductase subunit M [Verrucomicrobiota bacterium]|nr:NADH-quinone oxidoreductase subunit M [Limisphaera sp.]MDW8382485.1 NADH-quinone oxidoreductase subunit M [Verrucomicrobiota bacterium]
MTMLGGLVGLPLLGAVAMLLVPRDAARASRRLALAVLGLTALFAGMVFVHYPQAAIEDHGYRMVTRVPGLGAPALGIECRFGVDGLNVGLLLMGALVAWAAAACARDVHERSKEFYFLLLLMTGGILGAFASLDLFFFYFFHELALVPTFIMIGVWGRGEDRSTAAYQMTLYLSAGALLVLIGLVGVYLQVPAQLRTFDIPTLTQYFRENPLPADAQAWLYPLLLFGFGILVSLWPFHAWAPTGYASAPAATAMLHAGVLKKFGLYGLMRVAQPWMPQGAQDWMPMLAGLALGNLLYGGWVAMREQNLGRLLGYASVAHMGFVFLGLAAWNAIGVTGAVVVMVAHGFLAAVSFALVGHLYGQAGTLSMDRWSGLGRVMPFWGAIFTMAALAGCGLPGFVNFVGEVTVLFGLWQVPELRWVTVGALFGALVVGAVYMLRAVRQVVHGAPSQTATRGVDLLGWQQRWPYALLVAILLFLGWFPQVLVSRVEPAVAGLIPRELTAVVTLRVE